MRSTPNASCACAADADRRRSSAPREIGDVWHAALEEFARRRVGGRARRTTAARAAAARSPSRVRAAQRRSRVPRAALAAHRRGARARSSTSTPSGAKRRARSGSSSTARSTSRSPTARRFTLTARADRIERLREGGAALIDYKTGAPPGVAEVQVGFAPQLTLEAAMLARGAFADIGALEPATALSI